MIKKTPAPLALRATTIRDLSASSLADVRGGTLVILSFGCVVTTIRRVGQDSTTTQPVSG